MTEFEKFQCFVSTLLERQIRGINISSQEKMGMEINIYHIFEKNVYLEPTYYELLDYLEEEYILDPLIEKIDDYYSKLTNT